MIPLFKTKVHSEAMENVQKVLESGWIGLGPKTEEFEAAFCSYIGCQYAIAFSSATAALHTAVKLAGWKQNYSVLSTPLTFVSTNHVLLYENVVPIFADTDLSTGCLDFGSIRRMCRLYRPQGLMIVHYGGCVVDLDLLYEIAREYHLTIIEDCAHACGARYGNEMVGARSKFACFSFHAVKNLPVGDGGMLTTNDEEIAQRAKQLRWLGIDKSTSERSKQIYGWRYDVKELGYKYYMNDINAAMGLGQLPHLDTDNTIRRGIYEVYKNAGLPMTSMPLGSSHHLAVMLAENREQKEQIMSRLTEHDIQYGVHYLPNYRYPIYKNVIRECKKTEEFYDRCISLPNHLYLQPEDLTKVIDVVKEVSL